MRNKILLLLTISTLGVLSGFSQSTLPFRGDTIRIYKQGGSAELVIENKTKDTTGFLYNKGGGRTEFRRVKKINDTTIVFGADTLTVGSGSGPATVTTKNPITKAGDSVAINIDATALAVKGNKLITKVPVLKRHDEIRGIATSDLDTGFIYRLKVGSQLGEFIYDPNDATTPDDSVMNFRTGDGKLLKRRTNGLVYVRDFGATPNDFSDDDAFAFNKMFAWIKRQGNVIYKVIIDEGRYQVNSPVYLPDSNINIGTHTNIEIEGYNASIFLNGSNMAIFSRMAAPDQSTVENYYLPVYSFVIRGIKFFGDGSNVATGQKAIDIGGTYSMVIEDCLFQYFDTAIVSRFALNPTIRNNWFQGNRKVCIYGGTGVGIWAGSTICNSGFNTSLITKNRFNNYSGSFASVMLDNPIGSNVYDNTSEGNHPKNTIWISGKESACQTDNSIEKLWIESGGGSNPKTTVIYSESRNNLYVKNIDVQTTEAIVLNAQNADLDTKTHRYVFDGLRVSGLDTAFIIGSNASNSTFELKNLLPGKSVYDYFVTASKWGGFIPYHLTIDGYNINSGEEAKVLGFSQGVTIMTGQSGGIGSHGTMNLHGKLYADEDNTYQWGGFYGSLNRRPNALYLGTFGAAVDLTGSYWWGDPASLTFDLRLKRDSAKQMGVLDAGSNYGNLKAARGIFTQRTGYASAFSLADLGDNDFLSKRSIDTLTNDPLTDKKLEVQYGAGLVVIGNSISIDQGAGGSYYTYSHYLNKIIGGKYDNYSIAGSSVTNIGDMLRNSQLPFNRTQLALYNNGINDIRFKKSSATKELILNCVRSFLVNSFKADIVDASAMTQSGTWSSYNGLANTVVSKTNCLTTTELNASLSFPIQDGQPGIFISFITNADTSSTDWSDSVEIYRSGTSVKIATINPNKKGNAPNMPYVVWIPNTDSYGPITIVNRRASRLVVDYAGTTQFNNLCAPALVAEITKPGVGALQSGIGYDWWDEVNLAIRAMVKDEFIKYGYPVATIDVNNGFQYNVDQYELPGDPSNAIHPSTKAHFNVFLPQALKKISLVSVPKKIIEYATNTALYVSSLILTPASEKVIVLPSISQNSEILIPKDKYYLVPGQKVTIINNNTSNFTWNCIYWSYLRADGTTSTLFENNAITELVWTKEGFRISNKYNTAGYLTTYQPGASREKTINFRSSTNPATYFNYIENIMDGDPSNHAMIFGVTSNNDTTDAIKIRGDSLVHVLIEMQLKKRLAINAPPAGRARSALDVSGDITLGDSTGNAGDIQFYHRIRRQFSGATPSENKLFFDISKGTGDSTEYSTSLILSGNGKAYYNTHPYFGEADSLALINKQYADSLFATSGGGSGTPKVDSIWRDADSIRFTIDGRAYAIVDKNDDFSSGRHVDDWSTTSTTMNITIPAKAMVDYIIIRSSSTLANVKIGTTSGAGDLYDGPITAVDGTFSTDIPVIINKWCPVGATFYLTGNTGGNDISVKFGYDSFP